MSNKEQTIGQTVDEKINKAKEVIEDTGSEASDKGKELYDQAAEAVSNGVDVVNQKAKETYDATGQAKDDLIEGIKEMGQDIRKTGEQFGDKAEQKTSEAR